MFVPRVSARLWVMVCCLVQVNGRIAPNVIVLQQAVYDELEALERGALLTSPSHSSSDGSVRGQLGQVFHEFEQQNQESITAILRVLALVDHTLENTIKDCAKIFDLPSLDSENVLFRAVSRPLLVRVAQLCEQITSDELTDLERTMEAVQEEANSYRRRLDAARADMRVVSEHVNFLSMHDLSLDSVANVTGNRVNRRLADIASTIEAAVQNVSQSQRLIRVAFDGAVSKKSYDSADVFLLTRFMGALENETSLLAEDISEQLQLWKNQTEETLYMIGTEVDVILRNLIDSPISAFLEQESSLKCLAEYYQNVAAQDVPTGLENIFVCFDGEAALSDALQMVRRLLELVEKNVDFICEDLQKCFRSEGNPRPGHSGTMSCFEAAEPILDATEEFVQAKMNEIFFHLEDAINFEQLKLEACLYYKARELIASEELVNLRYRGCTGIEQPYPGGQYMPI